MISLILLRNMSFTKMLRNSKFYVLHIKYVFEFESNYVTGRQSKYYVIQNVTSKCFISIMYLKLKTIT